jgi:hypothetical protein
MKRPRLPAVLAFCFLLLPCRDADARAHRDPFLLLWWNAENLFDPADDPATEDEEFTPEGKLHWTDKKLELKRERISTVLKAVRANPGYGAVPDLIALAESENRKVFTGTLAAAGLGHYRVAYHESPDPRGIDVGLAWNPRSLSFAGSKAYRVPLENRNTRDVVVAGFSAAGRPLGVVLNHWPSRSFDVAWTERNRIAAARVARHVVDSLRALRPQPAVVVMGDFNDPPESRSVRKVLGSSSERREVRSNPSRLLYNCWGDVPHGGSYVWRGKWERIDQVLVSASLLDGHGLELAKEGFAPFMFPHMLDASGTKLYPTFEKRKYVGGYSDHLPLLVKIANAGN